MTPRSPTGDGEAMSRSAPLQGWSFSVAHHDVLQELLAPLRTFRVDQTTETGDGEHLSPPEPVGGHHLGSGAKPQFSDYFHHLHQERLSGAVNAACAVCSSTWSSWTSRRRASSSSDWAWTCVWSMFTKASTSLLWPLGGWALGCSSTSQRKPWGVGSRCAVSSPLLMRRRIVSVDTPRRTAASPTDTFSTILLLVGMGNSICFCPCGCLGTAQAGFRWFGGVPPW